MKSITVSIEEEHIEILNELSQDDGPCDNRSEAMRMIITQHAEIERLKEENERLHREKRQILDQREEHNELLDYVKEEKSIQERREKREDAPAFKRIYWWCFGRGDQNILTDNE